MKHTKKLLVAVMALAMVSAIAPMSAFAVDDTVIKQDSTTKSGTMTATYDVTAKYTVTIPAGVTLDSTNAVSKNIEANDVMLESGKKITVKLTGASNTASGASFSAKTTKGDSTATYTISKGETAVAVGDVVAEFTENGTQALTFSKAEGATYAGAHTETLTFGISVESASTPVTAITLNKTETLLGVGSTETLSVSSVTPDNATDQTVTWSSDNTSVATVDASTGVVTGVAKGTANITATANDGSGVSATCAVKVSTLAAAFVDGAVIKVSFKWRGRNAGDYVQGTYSASSGTFTVSKGGSDWGTDSHAVYKVEKSGNNITIGAGLRYYEMEGMQWTFNAASDTYTYTPGDMAKDMPTEFGLISVTLNGTDITSQLTKN